MKIAICDDNVSDLIKIEDVIRSCKKGKDAFVYKTNNPRELVDKIIKDKAESDEFDVLFLDIEMPEINGFDLAKAVESNAKLIIFISHRDDLVFESIKLSPFRFIRKSHLDDIDEALEAADNYIKLNNRVIELKIVSGGRMSVPVKEIIYAESYRDIVKIITTKTEYNVRISMKELCEQLGEMFFRTHRSFIINIEYIYMIKKSSVELLVNGKLMDIPLKRRIYNELSERFISIKGL